MLYIFLLCRTCFDVVMSGSGILSKYTRKQVKANTEYAEESIRQKEWETFICCLFLFFVVVSMLQELYLRN